MVRLNTETQLSIMPGSASKVCVVVVGGGGGGGGWWWLRAMLVIALAIALD
jgi:hypothetical protein